MAERRALPSEAPGVIAGFDTPRQCERVFASSLMAGFEGSTLRRPDGTQLDLVAATRHDRQAETDDRLVAAIRASRVLFQIEEEQMLFKRSCA